MSKWKKQKGGYSVILNYLRKSVRVDEHFSAADVTLKCVYSYLFTSVHFVIELLRLVVNLGGGSSCLQYHLLPAEAPLRVLRLPASS